MKLINLIFLLIIISLVACNKEEDTVTTSSISGKVKLYDDGNSNLDNNDMTITVEGTSPLLSAKTNQNGEYSIQNIPFGSYTLQFNKIGYGTYKIFDAALTNSSGPVVIAEVANLGQISNTAIINKFSVSISETTVEIKGTVNPTGTIETPKYVRLFYSTDENVSNSNYTFYSDNNEVSDVTFNIQITKEDLNTMGFETGTTVYIKAYGESYWSNSYEDPSSSKMLFPNLNSSSSEAASFIVPD